MASTHGSSGPCRLPRTRLQSSPHCLLPQSVDERAETISHCRRRHPDQSIPHQLKFVVRLVPRRTVAASTTPRLSAAAKIAAQLSSVIVSGSLDICSDDITPSFPPPPHRTNDTNKGHRGETRHHSVCHIPPRPLRRRRNRR